MVVLFGGDLGDRVRVEDSSTMALSAANAATRAWRARLFTAGVAAAGLVEAASSENRVSDAMSPNNAWMFSMGRFRWNRRIRDVLAGSNA